MPLLTSRPRTQRMPSASLIPRAAASGDDPDKRVMREAPARLSLLDTVTPAAAISELRDNANPGGAETASAFGTMTTPSVGSCPEMTSVPDAGRAQTRDSQHATGASRFRHS